MVEAVQVAADDKPASGRSSTGGTVVTVQYLRAIAASLVVFHHAMAPPALQSHYQHPFGEFGVDLFFVISGYIMWATTAGGRRGPAKFWMARIVRIVPLYWLYTTLFLAAAYLVPKALFTQPGLDPIFVLKSYLFVPAVHPHFGGVVPLYTLGWTLNYEMFFYLVFGACLLIGRRDIRLAVLMAALVFLVLVGRIAAPPGPVLATYTNPILLEFLAGVALASVGGRLQRCPAMLGAILITLGVAWLVCVVLSHAPLERIIGYGIPAAIMVAGGLVLERFARAYTSRLGLLLGDASYSIYLAHPFAQRAWLFGFGGFLPTLDRPLGAVIAIVAGIVAGILGGVLSYILIERPLLAAGHRLTGRGTLAGRTAAIESRSNGAGGPAALPSFRRGRGSAPGLK